MSRLVAGNVVSHVLADFGAEVIKLEAPGRGDDLRAWKVGGVPTYWKVYARNKKSITLDFRQPKGKELLLQLSQQSQILIENFIPGKLEAMGIGPDVLFKANPKLVIVRVSGWGQTGPFAHKPGFGTLVEAASGFAAMNGFIDRPPLLPPLALADMISGIYGASATMIALRNVEINQGKGQIVDLSLFESIHSILGPEAANLQQNGVPTLRNGSRASNTAPRNVYTCKDGKFVALSASMQSMAQKLFRLIGQPELIECPQFKTNTDRVNNNDQIDAIVAQFILKHTQADMLKMCNEAGVTIGPVFDASDLASNQYIEEREVLVNLPDADMGQLPMHNIVPRLSGTPGVMRMPAPQLGEHNQEIYSGLGLDNKAIEELHSSGII
jgi:formyl-CoA transferase